MHLIHGPDPITVLLSAAMLVALIWFRHDFRAQGDPGSLQQAIFFVPVYLLGVFFFTWITLFAERDHVSPDLTFGGIFETAYLGLIGLDGPYTYGREVFADFFEIALLVLGVGGLLIFLYLLLRTFVQAEPPSAERRRHAEEIVRQWGDDTLDYFALRRDKNYFFSSRRQSLIAYLYVRGTAMVAADPIGPPGDEPQALDEFLAFCAERGWRVAFFAVREADAEIYRERGMHVIYLGDEAILRCDEFSLDGAGMKAVRAAVKHVEKDHSFELIAETEASPELIAELNEISEEWRKGAPERGFTMELGEDVEGTSPDFVIAVAREKQGGRVAGFLRFVPVYGERTRLLARPDAAPARLRQRHDRVPDRRGGAGARRPRLQAALAQLRRLGPAARQRRGRRPLRPPAAADGERAQPLLPDPEPARLQPEVRPRVGAALGRDRRRLRPAAGGDALRQRRGLPRGAGAQPGAGAADPPAGRRGGRAGAGWRRRSWAAISWIEISSRTSTPSPKTAPNWDSTKVKTRVMKIETSSARVSQA